MVGVEQFFISLLGNVHQRNFKMVSRPGPSTKMKFYTLLKKPKVVTLKIPENTQSIVLNVHSLDIYSALFYCYEQ